jgi:hypothetical protein
MSFCRKPRPSDASDEECSLVAICVLSGREDARRLEHDRREVFDGLRHTVRTGA